MMAEHAQSLAPVNSQVRRKALRPQDLQPFFVERVNARDLEGLEELYEPDAAPCSVSGYARPGAGRSSR